MRANNNKSSGAKKRNKSSALSSFFDSEDDSCQEQMKPNEMSDSELWKKRGLVRLNNKYRMRWDVIVIFLSVMNSIFPPIEFSFSESKGINEFFGAKYMTILDIIVDLIFIFDLVFNFFTTHIHPRTGEEEYDKKIIA